MRTIKKYIFWTAPADADLDCFRIYVSVGAFDYGLPFIQVPKTVFAVTAPDDFPEGTFAVDTDYNIFVTALDDLGNESDPLVLTSPFDFVPPGSPPSGGISDVS